MPPRLKPIAGSRRPSKPHKSTLAQREAESSASADFTLEHASTTRPAHKIPGVLNLPPAQRKRIVLALPFEQLYTQKPNLPLNAPRLGIQQLLPDTPGLGISKKASHAVVDDDTISVTGSSTTDHPVNILPDIGDDDDHWGAEALFAAGGSPMLLDGVVGPKVPSPRYRLRRVRQFARWQEEIIPLLIQPYLDIRYSTKCGRVPLELDDSEVWGMGGICSCGQKGYTIRIILAHWDRLEETRLRYCKCKPAAVTLMKHGMMACSPIQPSIAFDINLMELISLTMLNMAPNVTGWTLSLETFWLRRGYTLGLREALRKRFSNAIQWFNVLEDAVTTHVANEMATRLAASNVYPPAQPSPSHVVTTEVVSIPSPPDIPDTSPLSLQKRRDDADPSLMPPSKKRKMGPPLTEPQPTESSAKVDTIPPVALSKPSTYLQACCPACFGDKPALKHSQSHVLVCLDANFTQKCLQSKYDDPSSLQHPQTHFISKQDLKHMEDFVESIRSSKKPTKTLLSELELPDEVLDECEKAFIAAQEKIAKASTKNFTDTGLMAILCRHDRLLWVVNLTSAGEKQYYAFALLEQLFKELPDDWHVGLLYDIACQLHRSMQKWGFLKEVFPRMQFGVSVFHAYGHQWACQSVYHPRKRIGFGLTDGEGCERFWSNNKRLIPSLRISGRHRRQWILDRQFHHHKKDTLRNLALNIKKKRARAEKKMGEAKAILCKINVDEAVLREEWRNQVKTQTAPIERQGKNKADKALEKKTPDDNIETLESLNEDLSSAQEALESTTKQLQSAEQTLGLSGAEAKARLKALKGSEFLRYRMNARAVKSRIRSKVIAQKFKRGRLERAYRHHVMQEKDHAQTKALLKRGTKSISSLVAKYNRLVELMRDLKRRFKAPARARMPALMKVQKLFSLDVNDDIWNEDGLGDDDTSAPPGWLANQDIRNGISALLEQDRCEEELERLKAEETNSMIWLRHEVMCVQTALLRSQDDPTIFYQLESRLAELWQLSEHWHPLMDRERTRPYIWMDARDFPDTIAPPKVRMSERPPEPDAVSISSSEDSVQEHDLADEEDELGDLCEQMGAQLLEEDGEEAEESDDDESVGLSRGMNVSSDDNAALKLDLSKVTWKVSHAPPHLPISNGLIDIAMVALEGVDHTGMNVLSPDLVILEDECEGENACAHQTTPLVLWNVRELLDKPGSEETATLTKAWIAKEIAKVRELPYKRFWVIPAHVPGHWTIVAIDWQCKSVHFMDSLPNRLGAEEDEQRVQDEVWLLLELVCEGFVQMEWEWISEQKNSYDCGAFVLADIASFFACGKPSTMQQDAMKEWRSALVSMLDMLPGLQFIRIETDPNDPIWVID
ncbi:hypothetical protein M422DRAFT_273977 [Sphaerobolus stellatus SS14]|uniref:Ubiquitin-like protease family profile domain-containing protein n=1 Tax=Sphaerobolus stellatus (strain SS14) TaxID=990650 RepID=A0A0C9TT98_SPHS4|nr:hypothetical protein M422DRAFT_273977 [Sphaerobolus stellatus SS14]